MPYKKCPQCGRLFYVPDPLIWVYRSNYKKNGYEMTTYLCRWSCFRTFEQENGIKRYKNRDGALFSGAENDKEEDFQNTERIYKKHKKGVNCNG